MYLKGVCQQHEEQNRKLKLSHVQFAESKEQDLKVLQQQLEKQYRTQQSASKREFAKLRTGQEENIALDARDKEELCQKYLQDLQSQISKKLASPKGQPLATLNQQQQAQPQYPQLLEKNYNLKQKDRFLALQREYVRNPRPLRSMSFSLSELSYLAETTSLCARVNVLNKPPNSSPT